jgi:hypothetical protein
MARRAHVCTVYMCSVCRRRRRRVGAIRRLVFMYSLATGRPGAGYVHADGTLGLSLVAADPQHADSKTISVLG